ncbi:MAG: hypothetical protein ABH828_02335 [archaeon]
MEIKKQEENKLLERTEIEAEIAFSGTTPSRGELKKMLAKQFNSDEKLVIVRKIETQYGKGIANIEANIYKKDKEVASTEPKHIQKRHAGKKKEGGDTPAEEAEAEAPKEETKKEAPAEEVKKEEPEPVVEEAAPEPEAPKEEKPEEKKE